MSAAESGNNTRSDILFMLISAAAFGYFGFGSSWAHQMTTTNPPVLLTMVVLLKWTLRCGAVVFLAAALLSLVHRTLGSAAYAIAGLVTAGVFAVVAIWEWTNPQGYFSGVPAFLLMLFAVWNGYGSWCGFKDFLSAVRRASHERHVFGADAP
jgi:hypothetical protein